MTAQARELFRVCAERSLHPPAEWVAELEGAIFAGAARQQIADDPELGATARRAITATITGWVVSNVHAPGEPVRAGLSDAPLTVARDLVRRGFDESIVDAFRAGQNVAWRHWMHTVFEQTADPDVLAELLHASARSIADFVDQTVAEVIGFMQDEREQLARDARGARREVVGLILQGAPITSARATQRLRYPVDGLHHAYVVWSEAADPDLTALDAVADLLAPPARGGASMTIAASTGTRWTWSTRTPAVAPAVEAASAAGDIRIAIGGPAAGLAGFRRAHLDALTVQRLLGRVGGRRTVAHFADAALASLAIEDEEAAARFVATTLGELREADPELRMALRAFLAHGCNTSAAAASSYTHRNTLQRRVDRARMLLPDGRLGRVADVATALEILAWTQDAGDDDGRGHPCG